MPPRQPALPFSDELNRALMSSAPVPASPGMRSKPASLFASAMGYHVSVISAGPPAITWMGDADPSVAAVAVHARASKLDWMRISAALSRTEPQMLAANRNAIRRCSPMVVPEFPPTGVAGVGSLKPTPGALTFTMVIVDAASDEA